GGKKAKEGGKTNKRETEAVATTAACRPQGVQEGSDQAARAGGGPFVCDVPPAAYDHRREEGPRRLDAYSVAEIFLDSGRQGRCREEQVGDRQSVQGHRP